MRSRFVLAFAMCLGTAASAADKPGPAAVKPPTTPQGAAPAADTEACARMLAAIETSEKEIASIRADGPLDNSAPRETMRLLARLTEQQKQTQNLMMMVAMKCPLPVGRMRDGWRYYASALECRAAYSEKKKEEAKQICDRDHWSPSKMTDDPQ